MRVKRYLVDTMPEAMLQIRHDLGSDAVILSTKETKIGGFLGMFKQKKIEVVAAVEEEAQKPSKAQPSPAAPSLAVPKQAVPKAYQKTAEITSGAGTPQSQTAALKATDAGHPETSAEQAAANESIAPPAAKAAEPSKDGSPPAVGTMPSPQPEAPSIAPPRVQPALMPERALDEKGRSSAEDKLLEELREMKAWMAKISRQSAMQRTLPDVLEKLQDRLFRQDIEASLIQEWIGEAFEHWEEKGRSLSDADMESFIRDRIKGFLAERFGGGIAPRTKMVYVAGPTGVGKTTTIAKLAAEQLFRYHRKVGFITSDTYRISAVEQLRTYASILNVPLEVVQSPGDMQRAMERLDYCDLILMDTAGRNYRNELLVSELQSLLPPVERSETYLVLSLTSKSQDMKKIAEHFSKYGLDKVIFTKLDETGSYGPILNLLKEFPFRLSYMTNGQNVPDDLLLPGEKLLSDLLLGEEGV
jgi:flagellar biosynthesis protein FlhF